MVDFLNWFYTRLKSCLSHDTKPRYLEGFYCDISSDWHWMGPHAALEIAGRQTDLFVDFEITCGPASHYNRFPFSTAIFIDGVWAGKVDFNECEQTYSICLQFPVKKNRVTVGFKSDACFATPLVGGKLEEKKLAGRITEMNVGSKRDDKTQLDKKSTISIKYSHSRLHPWSRGGGTVNSIGSNARLCPICEKNSKEPPLFLGTLLPTRNLGKVFYDLLECKGCGLIYQNPLPGSGVLSYLYSLTKQFDGAEEYAGTRAEVTLNFFRDSLGKLTSKNKREIVGFRLLEVGAGLSWMARVVKEQFSASVTVAQDVSGECVEFCSWVDHYIVGDLFDVFEKIEGYGLYQLISMTHVIEHLVDPVGYLVCCRKLLAENGMVFVTAPHRPVGWSEGTPFSLWENWNYNHVPGHLQYFNRKSIGAVAAAAGLRVLAYTDSAENGQAFDAVLVKK